MTSAVYPGSFDPPTHGHFDLIERGVKLFGKLTVAVGLNTAKDPLFTAVERAEMIRVAVADQPVEVITFDGLIVDLCRQNAFTAILRGLRTVGDFEYEYQMAHTNRAMEPAVDSIFLLPEQRYAHIRSSLIREIVRLGGAVTQFVPGFIEERMQRRFAEREESR